MKKLFVTIWLIGFTLPTLVFAEGENTQHNQRTYEILLLKKQIKTIAKKATSQLERQNEYKVETRKKLDPLIKRLIEISPKKTIHEKLKLSLGGWKNLWSDLPMTDAFADQIYQVVFPGYYYNIAKNTINNKTVTTLLRGEFELRENDFSILFTKSVYKNSFPTKSIDLYRLAMETEIGVYDKNINIAGSRGLGRPGILTTPYIDEDLRIVGGELLSERH